MLLEEEKIFASYFVHTKLYLYINIILPPAKRLTTYGDLTLVGEQKNWNITFVKSYIISTNAKSTLLNCYVFQGELRKKSDQNHVGKLPEQLHRSDRPAQLILRPETVNIGQKLQACVNY